MQISIDGATADVNDAVRGAGSFDTAVRALAHLHAAGVSPKLSVVCTRQNIPQLDLFKSIADTYGAQLRLTRLRPSGRGADVWDELHPTQAQQRELYDWLVAHGEGVLTGDSFFHLAAYGESLPGLNLCGAGRVVCLIDPVGDVYACPFAIHEQFLAGNVRSEGGFQRVWQSSPLFLELREPQSGGACASCDAYDACRGGCMAAKFFTGLPLDGPDPECVKGYGELGLSKVVAGSAPQALPGPLAQGRCARRSRAADPEHAPARSGLRHRSAVRRQPPDPAEVDMADAWFETVAEAQRRAKKTLPKSVYMALVAGSERGRTLEDNVDAYSELGFAPHVANLASERDLSVTVLGQELALPVMISPTGVQAVHPDGEVAIGRAAAARGTAMGLSSFASKPVEEVVAVNDKTFFQLYWSGTRDQILARVERAKAAGCVGIIVTLDWSFSNGRDWGSPSIPQQIDFRTMVKFAPEVALRPEWALQWARSGALPDLTAPNMALPGEPVPGFFGAYYEWMQTPLPHLGRPALAAFAVRRQAHAQGRHAPGRREERRRRRLRRHQRQQPRRQQPRRHTGQHPGAAGGGGGRRARDRRAARRGDPSRVRRGQGGRARCQVRDDRPGLPLGSRGERAGRGRERPRHPARWHRLRVARHRQEPGARPHAGRPADSRRRSPAGSGTTPARPRSRSPGVVV